jgi:hypothetical protein
VPAERQYRLEEDDRIFDFLEVPPSGEALMPVFHVRSGREKRFVEYFSATYGSMMELLSISDAEALGLFGADGIAPAARVRLGNFLGIAHEPMAFLYDPPDKKPKVIAAFHGGLQPSSIRVPLFIV